jgi:uncharacterized protein YbaR (Trm112 family)
MRLLTQNFLACPVTKAYPLALTATQVDEVEVEYSRAFILRMLPRIDWAVLLAAAAAVPGLASSLPAEAPTVDDDDEVLTRVHIALLQWHVVDGTLTSPEGHRYAITAGIPNMVQTAAGTASADSAATAADGEEMQS